MDFELLDDELEETLYDLLDKADEDWVEIPTKLSPEHRELERQKYIEDIHQYIIGTSAMRLTYKGLHYRDRKEMWEKEKKLQVAKDAGKTLADKGMDFAATVLGKSIGL